MKSTRRALLIAGAVATTGAVATVLLWPRDSTDTSGGERTFDDLPEGVRLEEKGFAVHPPRQDGDESLLGAGAKLSNTADTDLWITVAYLPLDEAGAVIGEEINPGGKLPLPAGAQLGVGIMEAVADEVSDAVAGLAIRVYPHEGDEEAEVITAEVRELSYDDPFDHVEFSAANDGEEVDAPDYGLLYYDARGDIIGGWHTNRLAWDSFEDALPEGESDTYPAGESDHTLPVWLPPDLTPDQATLTLWTVS